MPYRTPPPLALESPPAPDLRGRHATRVVTAYVIAAGLLAGVALALPKRLPTTPRPHIAVARTSLPRPTLTMWLSVPLGHPRLHVASGATGGGLPEAVPRRILRHNLARYESCLANENARTLPAEAILRLAIGSDGYTTSAVATSDDLGPRVTACFAAKSRDLAFPVPDRATTFEATILVAREDEPTSP